MKIKNFEEKGLLLHELSNNFRNLTGRDEEYYLTKDMQFFVCESVFNPGKWTITPATPEAAIKISHERYSGNEQDVLNKLKEWTN